MRMLHIHNPMHRLHELHWEELRPRVKQVLVSPVFWAIVAIVAVIALLILLAALSPQGQWHEFPSYPYSGYPFVH